VQQVTNFLQNDIVEKSESNSSSEEEKSPDKAPSSNQA